ncbi:MAG: insulinase family protein [Prevotella sp.]|nr:insulinase family protein [Prevotella sp.]
MKSYFLSLISYFAVRHCFLFFIFYFAACGTLSAKEYNYVSFDNDLTKTRIYTLDNGLKVYLSVNPEKPRIQTFIAVKTGSRNDPAETTGLAHYLEHLMFKGTNQFGTSDAVSEAPLLDSIQNRFEVYRTLTDPDERKAYYNEIDSISQIAAKYNIPNEYDKLMASIGSSGSNAYTWYDETVYVEDIPSNEINNWAKIQADRFMNMVIRGFHTELEAVYEEYNISLADDEDKMWNALFAKAFPNHPYGTQTTIGTQEHLKNPSIVNIKNYFKRYYCPNNVAVCMSGDFNPDDVIATIDKYFGSWKPNNDLSYPYYAPVPDLTAHVDTTVIGQESENIYVAWKFDGAASLQADTLSLIDNILANGKAGMLDLDLKQNMKVLDASSFLGELAEYSGFILDGTPKEGQSLDEVKDLLLGEIEKLKSGDFSDDMLPSILNNMKLDYYKSIENNWSRAQLFVDAFINGKEWSNVVNRLDRLSKISKQDIIDFANRHFGDNYVTVYKIIGNDTTQKKIDKPHITPIPANRDEQSDFVKSIVNSNVEPIQPKFLDFDKDLVKGTTSNGLPVLYVPNTENGRFEMCFRFNFGEEADKWLPYAAEYFSYLGTDNISAEQLKLQFYKLACDFNISVNERDIYISLNGLDENMPQALALMEDILANAKVDKDAYTSYVDLVDKARKDDKLDQSANFLALRQYGMYGTYSHTLNKPSIEDLQNMNPQSLVDMIKGLRNYSHSLLYYGPTSLNDLIATVDKEHSTPSQFTTDPVSTKYTLQTSPENEIIIAPYEAKNIYMVQYHNEDSSWSPEKQAVIQLFNEYFGEGMNALVFQELRETRGLAYSAAAWYATPAYKDVPEYMMTYIVSQNDKMMDCINTFNSLLNEMPLSDKSFDLAKQSLKKSIETGRSTKFNIIRSYLNVQNLGIDYDIREKVYNALPSLTLSDITNFEKENIAAKPYRYIILGDPNDIDIESLKKIAPVKQLTTEDIFGY